MLRDNTPRDCSQHRTRGAPQTRGCEGHCHTPPGILLTGHGGCKGQGSRARASLETGKRQETLDRLRRMCAQRAKEAFRVGGKGGQPESPGQCWVTVSGQGWPARPGLAPGQHWGRVSAPIFRHVRPCVGKVTLVSHAGWPDSVSPTGWWRTAPQAGDQARSGGSQSREGTWHGCGDLRQKGGGGGRGAPRAAPPPPASHAQCLRTQDGKARHLCC